MPDKIFNNLINKYVVHISMKITASRLATMKTWQGNLLISVRVFILLKTMMIYERFKKK